MPRPAAVSCVALLTVLLAAEALAQEGGVRQRRPRGHALPGVSVGLEAHGYGLEGGGVGAHARVEGRGWGMDARVSALVLDDEDALVMDELASVHLTYTLLAASNARLRLSGGVDSAHAPGVSAYGPGLGLSLEACLVGPFDLELRGQMTPYPFRRLDAQAGLALQLGPLGVRAGVRGLYLDDAGLADGLERVEALAGPYLGLALTF